jgi:hypothetical protein
MPENQATESQDVSFQGLAQRAMHTSAAAWCDLFRAVDGATRKQLGLIQIGVEGGILFAATAVSHLMLNRVLLAPPAAIAEAVVVFRNLGVRQYLLSFDADDIFVAGSLGEGHGLVRFRRPWATFVGHASKVCIPARGGARDVVVRLATSGDAARAAALVCRGFDVPPRAAPLFAAAVDRPGWTVLVAEIEGQLAGVGMAFTHQGCAHLFAGVTAESHRCRGVQRLLVGERVRLALAAGADLLASETGVAVPGEPNPSWNNLVRAGLQPIHQVEHLCPAGSSWSGSAPSSSNVWP